MKLATIKMGEISMALHHRCVKVNAVVTAWWEALQSPRFVFEGMLSLMLLLAALYSCREVIQYAHMRPGVPLDDPILKTIGPVSLRWPVFIVLWVSLFAGLLNLCRKPSRLLMVTQAAAVLAFLRAIALYLVPLVPLPTIIPLADPVATLRTSTGTLITNDLFFSGHTATLFLLFLAVESPRLKGLLLVGTAFTGAGVLLMHVHYSGDVFAAPFFACGSWMLVRYLHEKYI